MGDTHPIALQRLGAVLLLLAETIGALRFVEYVGREFPAFARPYELARHGDLRTGVSQRHPHSSVEGGLTWRPVRAATAHSKVEEEIGFDTYGTTVTLALGRGTLCHCRGTIASDDINKQGEATGNVGHNLTLVRLNLN